MNTSRRLAKNTLYMYARMVILMIISVYTSRIVLRQLGVDDYGIYNLVGSVVALFSSLRSLFASSTQRFLNYEMGKGSIENLQTVFSMSLQINLCISIIFVIIAEIVGYVFFTKGINIPIDRYNAAYVIFHLSLLSAVLTILTTPYDAIIIAHEKMNFYAYLSLVEGGLRLLVVYLLAILPVDKLIMYAVLQLCVSILIRIINVKYCRKHYEESVFKFIWSKPYFIQMTKFAGWNFFGNTAYAFSQSGLNMILNIFGGPAVNAARGIAYQVRTALDQLLSSVVTVINPFCVKLWAEEKKTQMFDMVNLSSKLLFTIQTVMVIPFMFSTYKIIQIWLGQVPDYTVAFLQIILIISLVRSLHYPIDTLIKAEGDIRLYQLIEGCVLSLPLLCSYVLLKYKYPFYMTFISVLFFEVINMIFILYLAKQKTGLSIASYLRVVILPCSNCLLLGGFFYMMQIYYNLPSILMTILTIACVVSFMFLVGITKKERMHILSIFKTS